MRRLPLHQELFLFAHDQRGTPAIHLPSLCAGLAGAALIDLALTERVGVLSGRIIVQRNQLGGEPVTDAILTQLAGHAGPRELGGWLRALAATIYERATGCLVAGGLLARTTRGRWRGTGTYRPFDTTYASIACARMRWATYGHERPDPQCAALCGLTAVLRLERGLHLDAPTGDILARLRDLSRWHYPAGEGVIGAVEALVGETAVSVYR
jgi:Golgi phosphoprotein 3 (GPP34)